ncbi:hypothetical protein NKI56_14190 [Mesorhizobium sp. M0622]|uniref:hypothetical protein n=1 Tax=unclassified Mesorhizobium TaxID=325217 RepID=UPI003339E896
MKMFILILHELVGMFIDDEFLAFAVLGLVAAMAALAKWTATPPLVLGSVLLGGSVIIVVCSALIASRKRRP